MSSIFLKGAVGVCGTARIERLVGSRWSDEERAYVRTHLGTSKGREKKHSLIRVESTFLVQ